MNLHLRLAIAALLLTCLPNMAAAQQYIEPDNRVVMHTYSDRAVFDLTGHMGYVTTIEFGERITGVTVGDPGGWDITPLGNRTLLSVKPLEPASRTNMTVIGSSGRVYTFRLEAHEGYVSDKNITYRVAFRYPGEEAARLAALEEQFPSGDPRKPENLIAPGDLNFDYAYRGDDDFRPVRAFDDGVKTYFQWPENRRSPAIFIVDAEGRESLVNYSVRGGYFVVHSVARQFTLRDGSVATCIYNLGYPDAEGFDAGSPELLAAL